MMEEAMTETESQAEQRTTRSAVDRLLAHLRDWWRARDELIRLDRAELERIAGELGMSAHELEDLAARGPAAVDQLYERMRLLGLTSADAQRLGHGMMRDLERTCACCGDKSACEKDLARHPDDPAWTDYCPNAATLESIRSAKGRSCA
jgi:hypothetical protein